MIAYSRLKRLLRQRQISVLELHRRMQESGFRVNLKSLYRLMDEYQSIERLDLRVAGAICQVCAVSLSEWIVFDESVHLRTLAADRQASLNALMVKNNEGQLTERERLELRSLVREAEEITLANARTLAAQQQRLETETHEVVSHAP
jgi:Fe2+ or Zn2+ uptake regulation protein